MEHFLAMIYILRCFAYSMYLLWQKYKLTDWISMFAGGLVFIVGYVLGTMSWRTGASGLFVILNFLSGSAGLLYFSFKGLKIFSDADEELLALIYKEQAQLDMIERNQAVQNNYVYGHEIFNCEDESELEDSRISSDISQKDRFQGNMKDLSFFPCTHEDEETRGINNQIYAAESNLDRLNALDSPHYENREIYGRNHSQRIEAIDQGINESSDGVGINSPESELQIKQKKGLGTENYSTLVKNEAFKAHLSNQRLDDRRSDGEICNSYHRNRSENLQFSELYQSPSTMIRSAFISSSQPPLRNLKSISQQHLSSGNEHYLSPSKDQRRIRSTTSEYRISAIKNDFMQHYHVPRSGSLTFDSPFIDDLAPPDPRRHLKPAKGMTKTLPPLPTFQNSANNSTDSLSSTPLSGYVQSSVSTASTDSHFQPPLPAGSPFQLSHATARECDPLARQLSHPLILANCSFMSPHRTKCEPLTRLLSHPPNLETCLFTSRIPSPPPKARPTPPYRTRINMSMQNLKQSPPSIPRKNRSYM